MLLVSAAVVQLRPFGEVGRLVCLCVIMSSSAFKYIEGHEKRRLEAPVSLWSVQGDALKHLRCERRAAGPWQICCSMPVLSLASLPTGSSCHHCDCFWSGSNRKHELQSSGDLGQTLKMAHSTFEGI